MVKQNSNKKAAEPQKKETNLALNKKNYIMMLIGVAVVITGFILMAGGGSKDANVFNEAMFSFRRITLAPIVVIAGFIVVGVGIMKKYKQ